MGTPGGVAGVSGGVKHTSGKAAMDLPAAADKRGDTKADERSQNHADESKRLFRDGADVAQVLMLSFLVVHSAASLSAAAVTAACAAASSASSFALRAPEV